MEKTYVLPKHGARNYSGHGLQFQFVSKTVVSIPMELKFSNIYSRDLIDYLRKERGNFQMDYLDDFIIEVSFVGYGIEDIDEVFENDPVLANLDYFSDSTSLSIRKLTLETINRNKDLLSDFNIPEGIVLGMENDELFIDQFLDENVSIDGSMGVLFQRDKELETMSIMVYEVRYAEDT